MCGHIGIINREPTIQLQDKLIKLFTQGLYCDALRGKHGTGIHAVTADGVERTYKRALQASDFLELATAKKIIDCNKNKILMGHNRHATSGEHTDDNTHPFTQDGVTLFHNGTLTGWRVLGGDKSFDVDSDAVAYEVSISDDIPRTLEKFKGAYALAWYDAYRQTICFARNSERTFYISNTKDNGSIIYSSERGLIEWLAARNGIEISKIEALPTGNLLSIPLDPTKLATLQEFTPAENVVVDYSNYYSRSTKTFVKEPEMKGLKPGDKIVVQLSQWVPYNNNLQGTYGYCEFDWDEGTTFTVSGVTKELGASYEGKDLLLTVVSIASETTGYGKIDRILCDSNLNKKKEKMVEKEVKLLAYENQEINTGAI